MRKMLITGTTQGIGNELYNRFCKDFDVYTVNRREFKENNILCDLSILDDVETLCNTIKKMGFEILINNAGGGEPVRFENMTTRILNECTTLNYISPVMLMKVTLPYMKECGFGRIINISSIAAKSPRPLIPHYGAAKAALESFSESMAVAYANNGISINCICPGGVDTKKSRENRRLMAQINGVAPDYYNMAMSDGNGLGRMIKTSEVADLVEFLISCDTPVLSGQTINICGTKEVH